MIMRFVACDGHGILSMRLAADYFRLAEEVLPSRMNFQPIAQDRLHECRQGHTPACPPPANALLFVDQHSL